MHRLFVALRPPPAIRRRLLDMMEQVPGARWQDEDQLHLTLRFIGTVERGQAEDVASALAGVHAPAPTIRLAGVGRFDGHGRGGRHGSGALWAAVAPRDPLAALHRKIDQACIRAGIAAEGRAYLPHVTLARLPRRGVDEAAAARWLADHAALASEPFRCEHIMLYESSLGGEGAVYDAVARWPLEGD